MAYAPDQPGGDRRCWHCSGRSPAVIVGANAGVRGAKTITSSTGILANKTVSEIVDSINTYMFQQRWAHAAG